MATSYKIKGVKSANLLYSSGTTPPGAKEQMVFARAISVDVPRTDIDFMGDNQVQTLFSIDKVIATAELDKVTPVLWERAFGKTSAPQSGEISRYYFGEEAEELPPAVGLEVNLLALEEPALTKRTLRVTMYRCQVQPYMLPNMNSKEKHGQGFVFEALKTSTDVIGSSIPGAPTDGCYYSIAVLSS